MKKPLFQIENRVRRTYRGGKMLEMFLGKESYSDSFYPEDWVSSFTEAKNKDFIPGEGISRVLSDGIEIPITEAVMANDFGIGRSESGVLVKLLDAGERLGIQVHPTPEFSQKYFGCSYGKTECWHILHTDGDAAVYIGFKEGITREKWKELFGNQDVEGMLDCLHRISVKEGDTILVRSGTPHAIGAGCFLLEIQEPTDYTMRVEKITVSGDKLTPMQIHYGVGEQALLDCFLYEGHSEEETKQMYFLDVKEGTDQFTSSMYVTYDDTPCFALGALNENESVLPDSFVTLIITCSGKIKIGEALFNTQRGNKVFVPYGCGSITCIEGKAIVCYPPKI